MSIVDVKHECVDGWHEFTSPQIPGLYLIAEPHDLEAAFEDVPRVIEQLIRADYNIEVSVRLEKTYSEYLDSLPESHRPSVRHYSVEKMAA